MMINIIVICLQIFTMINISMIVYKFDFNHETSIDLFYNISSVLIISEMYILGILIMFKMNQMLSEKLFNSLSMDI
jgi:hypothetical protein